MSDSNPVLYLQFFNGLNQKSWSLICPSSVSKADLHDIIQTQENSKGEVDLFFGLNLNRHEKCASLSTVVKELCSYETERQLSVIYFPKDALTVPVTENAATHHCPGFCLFEGKKQELFFAYLCQIYTPACNNWVNEGQDCPLCGESVVEIDDLEKTKTTKKHAEDMCSTEVDVAEFDSSCEESESDDAHDNYVAAGDWVVPVPPAQTKVQPLLNRYIPCHNPNCHFGCTHTKATANSSLLLQNASSRMARSTAETARPIASRSPAATPKSFRRVSLLLDPVSEDDFSLTVPTLPAEASARAPLPKRRRLSTPPLILPQSPVTPTETVQPSQLAAEAHSLCPEGHGVEDVGLLLGSTLAGYIRKKESEGHFPLVVEEECCPCDESCPLVSYVLTNIDSAVSSGIEGFCQFLLASSSPLWNHVGYHTDEDVFLTEDGICVSREFIDFFLESGTSEVV